MRQYTQREFIKICIANGFYYSRHNGDHAIYVNDRGRHISIPSNLESVIALRLIKENNLEADIKKLKRNKKMDNYNYPLMSQSEWNNAPWNQVDNPEREVEVLVSITLSKTFKVKVSDYTITDSGKDEDGNYFEDIDYSECDLKSAVESQIVLPHEAYKYIISSGNKSVKEELKGWDVDDFEVIEE